MVGSPLRNDTADFYWLKGSCESWSRNLQMGKLTFCAKWETPSVMSNMRQIFYQDGRSSQQSYSYSLGQTPFPHFSSFHCRHYPFIRGKAVKVEQLLMTLLRKQIVMDHILSFLFILNGFNDQFQFFPEFHHLRLQYFGCLFELTEGHIGRDDQGGLLLLFGSHQSFQTKPGVLLADAHLDVADAVVEDLQLRLVPRGVNTTQVQQHAHLQTQIHRLLQQILAALLDVVVETLDSLNGVFPGDGIGFFLQPLSVVGGEGEAAGVHGLNLVSKDHIAVQRVVALHVVDRFQNGGQLSGPVNFLLRLRVVLVLLLRVILILLWHLVVLRGFESELLSWLLPSNRKHDYYKCQISNSPKKENEKPLSPISQDAAPFALPYKIMNNKIKRIEVPKNSEKQIQRRPKRCHLCKKFFPAEKYNEHFQTCYRFGDKKTEVEKKPEQTRISEKNRVINASAPKKEEKDTRGREVADVGGRFRIKNVSNLTQTSKVQVPPSPQIQEERIMKSNNHRSIHQQRQQERSVSIDIRSEENCNISQVRQYQRSAVSRVQQNRRIENPEESLNQVNQGEVSNNVSQREPISQTYRPTVNENSSRITNNSIIQQPIVVLPSAENSNISNQPQSQPYDMQALMENTNSIITFIRTMNENGEDQSLNLMLGQLQQLNRIAEQIAELNQIGRSLSFRMGNVLAPRIHQVQSTIVNQIGIALIRRFNNRLGSEFDAIALRQPEIKVGFTQRQMQVTFPEKLSIDQQQCSICLQEIPPVDLIIELQCFHIFHPTCIKEWLIGSKKCPMCRKVQAIIA